MKREKGTLTSAEQLCCKVFLLPVPVVVSSVAATTPAGTFFFSLSLQTSKIPSVKPLCALQIPCVRCLLILFLLFVFWDGGRRRQERTKHSLPGEPLFPSGA